MQQLTANVGQVYDDFCGFVEKENRMSEFGLYGLSSAVFLYALYRKRPLAKFTKASDIPSQFVREKVSQLGVVRTIEPSANGPVLLVNHKPPLNLSFSRKALPIKVAGVNIDANGYSWLQILATDKKIKFIPINNTGNECYAKVFLVRPNKQDLDVGRALVGLGFAKAAPISKEIDVSGSFQSYHKQLKSGELRAKMSRQGQWNALPEPWLSWYLRRSMEKIVFNLKPLHQRLPALVR